MQKRIDPRPCRPMHGNRLVTKAGMIAVLAIWFLGGVSGVRADPPVAATQSLPGIVGQDDRQAFQPTDWPYTAIGRVNRQGSGRQAGGHCTGTLIGPRHVLTAAHCLLHPGNRVPVPPQQLHFVAGYQRGDYVFHGRAMTYVTADGFHPNGGPSLRLSGQDWAVIILDTTTDIRPIPIRALNAAQAQAALGQRNLMRVGYSQDRAHLPMRIIGCGLTGIGNGSDLWLHDCDATWGDSGSPLLIGLGADLAIIGLAVGVIAYAGAPRDLAVSASAFAARVQRILTDPALR